MEIVQLAMAVAELMVYYWYASLLLPVLVAVWLKSWKALLIGIVISYVAVFLFFYVVFTF
ncbi:MAG: hypothetical protein Q7S73_02785 [bacterium]|nr:hypothetical protein [bacterium]